MTKEDGSILLFDAQGVLKKIGNKIRQFIDVTKVNGRITQLDELISGRRPHLQLRRWQLDSLHPGRG
ncbi:MAG: hypothetical protein R2748_30650 [Bryobacterales bacterium]